MVKYKLNKIFFCSFLVCLFLSCSNKNLKFEKDSDEMQDEDLHSVVIKNNHFSIVFPEEPVLVIDTIIGMKENIIEYKYVYEKSVSEVYLLSYFHQFIPQDEIEKRMYAAADELLSYFDLNYKDKKFVTSDSASFFYFTAFSADIYIDFQLVYSNNYFYQAGIIQPFGYTINTNVHPFINSLKLL